MKKKDLAYRLRSQKAANAISTPSASDIDVAADEDNGVDAGKLQAVIEALAARIQALENP